ncbi:hypothetical protein DdX_15246 [Ditylenchus destructor]|uniref:Uncharacterized protein n=1 Tax=Ditylenchus destructor TaxID=166010 RepID=A0AAD4MPV7_9BILA|nr:hypothetical protein DdX_15246 [Ditylenchus destructor]
MNLRVRLAIDMLLSNSNLLRVRELQYRAWDYVQQVYNYPLVYEANIVRVETSHAWNGQHMVRLIEGKVLHPASPTIFVINSDGDDFYENICDLLVTLGTNFDNATTPRSYVVIILNDRWLNTVSRENNANEIWLRRNGGGEQYFHSYDQKWYDGHTCLLERFSIPSIL